MLTSRLAGRRLAAADLFGGVILIWLVFAVITGAAMPGMSYLFAWPALGASVIMPMSAGRTGGRKWLSPIGLLAVAAPTLVVMAPPRPGNPSSEMEGVVAVVVFLVILSVALIGSTMTDGGSVPG